MEMINISPYCNAGHSTFYTNEKLGIKTYNYATNYIDLISNMKKCYQFKDIDMYEHGLMVNREYTNLISSLNDGLLSEVFPPDLIEIFKEKELVDYDIMTKYQILHDCGKPLCKEVDDEGKIHYPNHAKVSFDQINKLYPNEEELKFLVLHDMDFHTLKPKELIEIAESKYGFSLYLTAWSELIANAQMFNGFDAVSFKIKRKQLIKCLKLFK